MKFSAGLFYTGNRYMHTLGRIRLREVRKNRVEDCFPRVYSSLMIRHREINDRALWVSMKRGELRWGGHCQLKIYGRLDCWSGRRMKRRNRVFFSSAEEAEKLGYRPCGHCMKEKYKEWISSRTSPEH